MEEQLENMDVHVSKVQEYIDLAVKQLMLHGPNILLAIIVLLIGLRVIKLITRGADKGFEKGKMDGNLRSFFRSMINWGLKAMLIISIASMIGIKTTSFVAVIGAIGLAIGLALQGTLGNFAGGALILIFKPYKVGDLIEAQGHLGVVKEIQLFVTTLLSPQNKTIIIPNGAISNGSITNYSEEGMIRVDISVGISYGADMKKAKKLLLKMLINDPRVLTEPAPFVGVSELADSSVNLVVRPYTKPGDYWGVFFDMTEQSKEVLDKNGIEIPFPQRDIHLYKHD